jgi:tetratricopeptide (TPR) repeat protein
MKVYCHLEDAKLGCAATTFAATITDGTTFAELIADFVKQFKGKWPQVKVAFAENLCARSTGSEKSYKKHRKVADYCDNHDDVLISILDHSAVESCPLPASSSSSTRAQDALPRPPNPTSAPSSSGPADEDVHIKKVKEALVCLSMKQFRRCKAICEGVIEAKSCYSLDAVCILGEISIGKNKTDEACEILEKVIKKYNTSAHIKFNYTLAKAQYAAERYDEAEMSCEACNNIRKGSLGSKRKAPSLLEPPSERDIEALRSESIFEQGRHGPAADIINSFIHTNSAQTHLGSLLAYSYFAMRYQKVSEPLQALLKAITIDQKNPRVRKYLIELLNTNAGMKELIDTVPPSKQSASAYAFMATIAKDLSAFDTGIKLLKIACDVETWSASFALNLVHMYEAQGDLTRALEIIEAFVDKNQLIQNVGKKGKGFTCQQLHAVLKESKAFRDANSPAEATGTKALRWIAPLSTEGSKSAEGEGVAEGCVVCNLPADDLASFSTMSLPVIPTSELEVYDDPTLDFLAIAFTLVKLLFNLGRLRCLPAIFELVDPARRRSKKPLHSTSIRNENAFYTCIAQVLSHRFEQTVFKMPTDTPVETDSTPAVILTNDQLAYAFSDPLKCTVPQELKAAAERPIYFVGDSHTLPPSWSVMDIKGQGRLVVPKLVTGVKQWHLRKDSHFYPKSQFFAQVRTIPRGSDVIFMVGEIDCREGLLIALERDLYPGIEAEIVATVKIFIDVLKDLMKRHKFKVFVHPIMPILKPTRQIVLAFNKIYRDMLREKLPEAVWLDILEDVFEFDDSAPAPADAADAMVDLGLGPGADIRVMEEYRLDGTHISPRYVKHLEAAINKA